MEENVQVGATAKLSLMDKLDVLRGFFNPNYFKDVVRRKYYEKCNNDPERVHEFIIENLKTSRLEMALTGKFFSHDNRLRITINGTNLTPFGCAAGLDKNGDALISLSKFFGFMEPGTLVVNPRQGNDRPRVYSDDKTLELYNAQGFPNKGLEYFLSNIKEYSKLNHRAPVYVSICGMPLSQDKAIDTAMDEMTTLLKELTPYVDGFVWNCASPNTEALKMLRTKEIFERTAALMKQLAPSKLRLVKLWPYEVQDKDEALGLVESFIKGGGQGVVTCNTKMVPKEMVPTNNWGYKSAGRSGIYLKGYRLRSVADLRGAFKDIVIVATGGIYDGDDAYQTFRAGADMLEGYTPYTFYGLGLIKKIENGVVKNLQLDGYSNLEELRSAVKDGTLKPTKVTGTVD